MAANCKPCAENRLSWLSLYKRCFDALKATNCDTVQVNWMMAICIKESGGNGYFSKQSLICQENLRDFVASTKLSGDAIIGRISVKSGPKKGLIPKFRFEPSLWGQAKKMQGDYGLSELETALTACSWGIAQQMGCFWLPGQPKEKGFLPLEMFMVDERTQLEELVVQCDHLFAGENPNLPLCFTRYNAGASCEKISKYGTVCQSISEGFGEALKKGGLSLCLD